MAPGGLPAADAQGGPGEAGGGGGGSGAADFQGFFKDEAAAQRFMLLFHSRNAPVQQPGAGGEPEPGSASGAGAAGEEAGGVADGAEEGAPWNVPVVPGVAGGGQGAPAAPLPTAALDAFLQGGPEPPLSDPLLAAAVVPVGDGEEQEPEGPDGGAPLTRARSAEARMGPNKCPRK